MQTFLSLYGSILRPWLCVVVYLWLLELQAVIGTAFEPMLDSLADLFAILWTLIFWTTLFCVAPALGGLVASHSTLTRTNERVCTVGCLIVSGFYFMRWLNAWRPPHLEREPAYWLSLTAVVALYLLVRRRRKRVALPSPSFMPSWKDCFSFGVLPLLFLSSVVLTLQIVDNFITPRPALATALNTASRRNQNSPPLPNIIVIVADSMRARSMSLYGNPGATTPFLERFGKTSNVYLNMHANSTTTAPSIISLLSGKHPLTHGRVTRELPPGPVQDNLMRILRNHDYQTAAVTSNGDATFSSLGFTADLTHSEIFAFRFLTLSPLREFGVYPTRVGGRMYEDLASLVPFLGFPQRTSPHGQIDDTLARAKELIPQLQHPFFLFVHIHEPHDPHLLPPDFKAIPISASELDSQDAGTLEFYSQYSPAFQPVVDAYKRQYEASVREVDATLQGFFGFLESQPWFQESLLVFMADHGESFERGFFNHGADLYENSTWVPLIVRFPGQSYGQKISSPAQTLDIAPTILHALNIPVPHWMEGQPLTSGARRAGNATVAINYQRPQKNISYPLPTKLAIWWNQYKMIISCGPGKPELYDLSTDSDERSNLADSEVTIVEELKQRLKIQLAKQSREPKLLCPNI